MAYFKTVMVIPAALKDKADALVVALGLADPGDQSFTVAMPSDDAPTHYVAHARVRESFLAQLAAAGGGTLPDITWGDFGLTEADVWAVLAVLIVSAPGSILDPEGELPPTPREHVAAVVARLTWVEEGEP